MQISGRNKFSGKIKEIKSGGVVSQVTLDANGQMVVAVITNDSISELGIKQGDTVTALVKATDVMLMK